MKRKSGIPGIFILAAVLLASLDASAATEPRIGFRLAGGLGYIGAGDLNHMLSDWNDMMTKVAPLYSATVDTAYATVHTGFDVGLEVEVWLSKRFGVALGAGWLDVNKSDNNILLTSPTWTDRRSRDSGIRSIPISLGGFYSRPVEPRLTLRGEAGLDYHIVQWRDRLTWSYNGSYTQVVIDEQNTNSSGLGGHLSVAMEYELSKRLALFVELRGRYARIGGFKGDWVNTVNDNPSTTTTPVTLYTYELKSTTLDSWYSSTWPAFAPPSEAADLRNIREAVMDLSGFALRVGVYFRL